MKREKKRELGIFFSCASLSLSVRLRKDLAELRHPQAENSVAALQLFNALPSSLALSVDKIVKAVHPPAEISVLALRSTRHRVSPRSFSQSSCKMRCRWCERSASSSASLQGRLRCMSQGGRWAIRAAARQAAEEVILRSCGGSNKHYRESEKARKQELGIFFPVPTVYAQQRLSRSGSVGAGPRGGGPTRNSITRSKGAEPGGA